MPRMDRLLSIGRPGRLPLIPLMPLILGLIATSPCRAGWNLQTSGTTTRLNAVTANHGNINSAWACGDGGLILHTTNGGSSWISQPSGTTENLYDIVFWELSGGPVVAVGSGGTILYTADGGATWQPRVSGTSETLRAITDFGTLIVGDNGTALYSEDRMVWGPLNSGTDARLSGAVGVSNSVVVGAGGTILRFFNQEFIPVASPTTEDLFSVPMFGDDIAVGDHGIIVQRPNAGSDWIVRPSGTTRRLNAMEHGSVNTSLYYAVGEDGVILKTTDGGASWGYQASGTTAELRGVFFYLNQSSGYAVGDGGTILRTTDGGGPVVPAAVDQTVADESGERAVRLLCEPNPFRGEAEFSLLVPAPGLARLEVFDALGRSIGEWQGEVPGGVTSLPFSPPGASASVYFARLATEFGTVTRRFVRLR